MDAATTENRTIVEIENRTTSARTLESVLQSELHLPHASGRRCDASEVRAAETGVGESPHRMVQEVVGLPSELQFVTFFRMARNLDGEQLRGRHLIARVRT